MLNYSSYIKIRPYNNVRNILFDIRYILPNLAFYLISIKYFINSILAQLFLLIMKYSDTKIEKFKISFSRVSTIYAGFKAGLHVLYMKSCQIKANQLIAQGIRNS